MSWLLLTVCSALLLGLYDFLKKLAVRDNAVMPVLVLSVATGAAVWLPFVVWSAGWPESVPWAWARVGELSARGHLMLFIKGALVGASWVCGYYGIKTLPLSIAGPIRSTGPLWTILFGVLVFHEAPSLRQWAGVAVILLSFFAFTFVGRGEGIRFHRDKGVFLMIGATLLGAASSLYDKFLLANEGFAPTQVQAWFTIYTTLLLLIPLAFWFRRADRHVFRWNVATPLIGLTLLGADILYFTAITRPDAMIVLISPVRRASVVVSFVCGVLFFREKHVATKAACIAGILAGLFLMA